MHSSWTYQDPVNKHTNPITHNIGVFHLLVPPNIVTVHLNIFIPFSTPIIIVASVKYAKVSTSIPTVNI